MAGTYFDYQPGSIEAKFSHDIDFDFINLDVRLVGDTTMMTYCDEQGKFANPILHKKKTVGFSVYFSSVFCPFQDFIRFLEAITVEVQECGFDWDPEGPMGRMNWRRRFVNDTGFLTIEWQAHKERFSHRTMLNTRQAVKALYESFRSFVDSDEYDPLRYEEISNGEAFQLVLSDASLDELVNALIQLNFQSAHSAISRLRDTASERSSQGPMVAFPLDYFLQPDWSELPLSEWEPWISEKWETLNQTERADDLRAMLVWGKLGWSGCNLRGLRSTLVEAWLAQPEPPPRRPFGIPVKPEVDAQETDGPAFGESA